MSAVKIHGAHRRARHGMVLAVVWLASALYAASFVDRGWVPHDEGMLGQNAERASRGELPHADFDESYTGGLSELHALAFHVLGARLASLRWVFFAFFLAFIPALYTIASRLLPPWPAGLVTLVGVAWSAPNYFASMPSWYVLFLSTFGVAFLVRELETGRKRWLFAAGVCAGLSLVVIVVGLYFVAAVLLYLAFREQALAAARPACAEQSGFFLFETAAVLGFLCVLLALVRARLAPMEVVHLVVPALAVSGVLLTRSWQGRNRGPVGERIASLGSLVGPFALGACLPVAIFLLPYIRRDALGDLFRGVFVLPFRQIATARLAFPPPSTLAAVLPYALLLAATVRGWRGGGKAFSLALGAALVGVLWACATPEVYRAVWHWARSLGVAAVLVGGAALVLRRGEAGAEAARREQLNFLLLSMVALLGLIQFPFAAPIYFCFVAPLVGLALAAVAREGALLPHGMVASFFLAFALWRLNPGYIWNLGVRAESYGPLAILDPPRAGLRVPLGDRDTYARLVAAIGARSRGPFIYATPDCPEVYFLSERRNPTRVVFDYLRDPPAPQALIRMLSEKAVDVVVVNEHPDYSRAVGPPTLSALAAAFPQAERIGKFLVRWRE